MLLRPPKMTSLEFVHQVVDCPELAGQIQHLAPKDLHGWISRVGLEDATALLEFVSTEQLFGLFDMDLWRSHRPGAPEAFDADRFGLWLEVLNALGAREAAHRLAALEPAFVVMALASQMVVFPLQFHHVVFPDAEEEDEVILEKMIESRLHHEFESYLAISKNDRAWDALLEILLELESLHSDAFARLMDHLVRVSQDDYQDQDGFSQLLSLSDQLTSDMAEAREGRREDAGYIAPAQAGHFLADARGHAAQVWMTRPLSKETVAYFERQAAAALRKKAPSQNSLADLLNRVSTPEKNRRALLPEADGHSLMPIHTSLAALAVGDAQLHAMRLQELTYLSNILIAGALFQDNTFRPVEAAQCAVATANLGLEQWLSFTGKTMEKHPEDPLIETNLVTLFCMGWSILYQQVSLPTALRLVDILSKPPRVPGKVKDKAWIEEELQRLKQDLEKGVENQAPWLHADQVLILDTLLDGQEVTKLCRLLGETPLWDGFIASLSTLQSITDYLASLPELFV